MNWILTITIVFILLFLFQNKKTRKKKQFKVDTLKLKWGKLKQVDNLDFDKIASYHNSESENDSTKQYISATTHNDLDLDDLFIYLDRTESPIGQQYLYHRLHTISNTINPRESDELVILLQEDEQTRVAIQEILQTLNNKSTYYYHNLFTSKIDHNTKILPIAYGLNIAMIATLIGTFFIPVFALLLIPLFAVNLLLHYKNKYAQYEHVQATDSFKSVHKAILKLYKHPKLKKRFDFTSYNKSKNKLIKLNKLAYLYTTDSFLKDELTTIIWLVIEWIKIMFNLELIAFRLFLKQTHDSKAEIHCTYQIIGQIDLALSIASLHENNTLTKPVFHQHKEIKIENLIHPLVENCITNDLHLINESLLLTGSNMSGKTTLIRAITINAILAQTIGYTFSSRYETPYFEINTSIRITDDLHTETSYYLQEVKQLKKFVEKSRSSSFQLFVLDEILKGTNTKERISAAYAILKYINNTNTIVLVSTHDLELIELLQDEYYSCKYLEETICHDELHFDYKLKEGVPQTTNAIKILELHGFPKEITTTAYKIKKSSVS